MMWKEKQLNSNGFMPHGYCFLWRPDVLLLHVVSDAGIGLGYYGISLLLGYLIAKRRDLPFPLVFWLFCAFILLCGTSHLLSIWVIWHPDYYIEGYVKAATAVVSLATLGVLIKYVPRALEVVSTAQLTAQNAKLKTMVEQSEERGRVMLTAIVDNVFDGIITFNDHGIISSFNAACTLLFGFEPQEVLGRNIKVLMPASYHDKHDGDSKSDGETDIASIMGTGGHEIIGRRKDGSVFPLDLSITSFTVDETRYFAGAIRDVSKQKLALEMREDLLTRLTASNVELERFAYVASHDMLEPVRMMLTFSQLLAEDYAGVLDADGLEYLRFIGSSATRMRDMIRDLMDYARMDGEQQPFVTVDLRKEFSIVKGNLQHAIDQTGAVLSSDPMPDVQGSPVQIMRLLQNLTSNAIRYQPAGQVPRVHLGVTEDSGRPIFYVEDNGLGIDPRFVDEIFQPFRRLHTWDAIQGTGLGLSVCRKIVENHGGLIWASSTAGQGTKISFTLTR